MKQVLFELATDCETLLSDEGSDSCANFWEDCTVHDSPDPSTDFPDQSPVSDAHENDAQAAAVNHLSSITAARSLADAFDPEDF